MGYNDHGIQHQNISNDVSNAVSTIRSMLGTVQEGKPWMYQRLEEAIETVKKHPCELSKLDEESISAINLGIMELNNAASAGENW